MIPNEGEPAHGMAASTVSTWERIKSDHQTIVSLLTELGQVTELDRILGILNELGGILPGHFSDEEGRGGLFEQIRDLRPEVDSKLKFLSRAHREIVEALDALREQVLRVRRGTDRIEEAKAAFARQVRAHEQAENSIVLDAYLTDEGGPD
jgi:hemerythrin superfamily protein